MTQATFFVLLVTFAGIYGEGGRVAYLQETLTALRATDPRQLEDAVGVVDVVDRNECRSAYHRLRAQCLVQGARRICRGRRRAERRACNLYSDVIVSNKLSEDTFVSTATRYRIMSDHRDFRVHLRRELLREYGSLAAELTLSSEQLCEPDDVGCLARAIDTFCLAHAETRSLSWQHCAAAVTWFVGTSRPGTGD